MRTCPKCKTNDYNNRSFILMINECGHSLCKNCVDNLFARHSAPCPTCGKTLKKNQFWQQIFDDPFIEKENHIRNKLRKIYNLREDDFENLRAFNDYLERIEHIVWNLTNDIDVKEMTAEIEQFKSANAAAIERNKKKLGPDEIWIQQQLDEERRANERLNCRQDELAENDEEMEPIVDGRSIIEELKSSDLPAEVILDRKRKRQIELNLADRERRAMRKKSDRESKISASVISDSGRTLDTIRKSDGAKKFDYEAPTFDINGPPLPAMWQLQRCGYLTNVRLSSVAQLAGGFPTEIGCYRALFESRCDLFLTENC